MSSIGSGLITDQHLLRALQSDRDSVQRFRDCVQRAVLTDGLLKRVKATEMKRVDHLAIAAQEREAYASDAYLNALQKAAKAAGALDAIKAERAHARLVIEVWRGLEASSRSVQQFP